MSKILVISDSSNPNEEYKFIFSLIINASSIIPKGVKSLFGDLLEIEKLRIATMQIAKIPITRIVMDMSPRLFFRIFFIILAVLS